MPRFHNQISNWVFENFLFCFWEYKVCTGLYENSTNYHNFPCLKIQLINFERWLHSQGPKKLNFLKIFFCLWECEICARLHKESIIHHNYSFWKFFFFKFGNKFYSQNTKKESFSKMSLDFFLNMKFVLHYMKREQFNTIFLEIPFFWILDPNSIPRIQKSSVFGNSVWCLRLWNLC